MKTKHSTYVRNNHNYDSKKKYRIYYKGSRKEALTGIAFLLPSLVGVMVFVLFPFTDAIRRSFTEAMSRRFVGLANYQTVVQNDAFKRAVSNTARFLVICLPLLLVISLILSALIYNAKTLKNFFKTTYLIPMAIPAASIVLLWRILFHSSGLINEGLHLFGINGPDWINSSYSFFVLVITYLWKNTGYDCVLWIAGLNEIPDSQYEAASIDGAGRIVRFFYITLPNLIPTFFIVTVLSLINSFKVFREAYLIAGNYPNNSIYMFQHLFNNWFTNLEIQKMCATAVLVAVTVLSVILLLQKITEEKGEVV